MYYVCHDFEQVCVQFYNRLRNLFTNHLAYQLSNQI